MHERDRIGLGWRSEIGLEIGHEIERCGAIDCLEVIAEQYAGATDRQVEGVRQLARLVPMSVHGVSMGLASTAPVPMSRLDAMARFVERVQPACWSEHLSLVRAGEVEIGHLAAAPRCAETVEAVARNVERAIQVVGTRPHLENVATLIVPPWSDLDECEWLDRVVRRTGASLLLDLHNLHANAVNTGRDAYALLDHLPLRSVVQIHLSGGMLIPAPLGGERLLDDHVHDVPPVVFELLEEVASRVEQPLMVIIERDGQYPQFDELRSQLLLARHHLGRGRARRQARGLAQEVTP